MRKSTEAIGAAVRECLSRCSQANFPLAALAGFVAQLRQGGWREADVHEVEATVRKLLAGIVMERGNGIWPPSDRQVAVRTAEEGGFQR